MNTTRLFGKRLALAAAALLFAMPASSTHAVESVLFIGNSFTYGTGSATRYYRADTVTDLNKQGTGGVAALFKSFADQAGVDYDVSIETYPGGASTSLSLIG